jgi:agmatine deiminase
MKVQAAALPRAMPAEWSPHRATWIGWPHNRHDWPGKFPPIPWVFAEVVRALAGRERVCILVQDATAQRAARRILARAGAALEWVDFFRVPTDRVWMRDTGPSFVRTRAGRRAAICWRFNGWAKYPDHKWDRHVAKRIAALCRVSVIEPGIVLEGGAFDVDGDGTLVATEECLLSDVQARNPGLGRADLERILDETLGVSKVIWLGRGIAGDDTHGHIDDVARFVAPARVVLAEERAGDNHAALEENRERLEAARDARGRRIEVIRLPMPAPLSFDGRRVPASYANFYVANGVVLCPTFNDPADRVALGILADLFPGRDVVGIHAVDLVWGLGTLHCMTQQEPSPSSEDV